MHRFLFRILFRKKNIAREFKIIRLPRSLEVFIFSAESKAQRAFPCFFRMLKNISLHSLSCTSTSF